MKMIIKIEIKEIKRKKKPTAHCKNQSVDRHLKEIRIQMCDDDRIILAGCEL